MRRNRDDIAMWWRHLFWGKKPTCPTTVHTDGDFLECNADMGWMMRNDKKKVGCVCEGCLDQSTALPPAGPVFKLPNVFTMPSGSKSSPVR